MPGLFLGQGMNQVSSRESCLLPQPALHKCCFCLNPWKLGDFPLCPRWLSCFCLRKGRQDTYPAWSKLKALYFVWLQLLHKIEVMEAEGRFLCSPPSFLSQAD